MQHSSYIFLNLKWKNFKLPQVKQYLTFSRALLPIWIFKQMTWIYFKTKYLAQTKTLHSCNSQSSFLKGRLHISSTRQDQIFLVRTKLLLISMEYKVQVEILGLALELIKMGLKRISQMMGKYQFKMKLCSQKPKKQWLNRKFKKLLKNSMTV